MVLRFVPSPNIFVFGSNLAGRHGRGAARSAYEVYGAKYGQGWGKQGNSYAIPTKSAFFHTLPLGEIKMHVDYFLEYARSNPQLTFHLTPIGCGLAGYLPGEIAPMFKDAPDNVKLPDEFKRVLFPQQ